MPERKTKDYFFTGQPINSNDKFLRQNIPTETTMRELLNSTAFIRDPKDGASPSQQGLIKIYKNDDAIDNRNNGNLQSGNIHANLIHQSPGSGVNDGGIYKESNPTSSADGVPVKANGIKVTGKPYTAVGIKRIGYAVEFDPSTLIETTSTNVKAVVLDVKTNTPALHKFYSTPVPGVTDANYEEEFTGLAVWDVEHNLGKYPAVTLLDSTRKEFVADITHLNKNQLTVTMRTGPTSGWCVCN